MHGSHGLTPCDSGLTRVTGLLYLIDDFTNPRASVIVFLSLFSEARTNLIFTDDTLAPMVSFLYSLNGIANKKF